MSVEPEAVRPSDSGLRECDDGRIARPTTQAEIEALRGCTVLYGLSVDGALDLRPLESLRVLRGGGLVLLDDTPLAGLENVEETTSLAFYNMRALDLSALKSLRWVPVLLLGSVDIVDLRGLERVEGIRSLSILDSPSIASLAGLIPPSEMDTVTLQGTPALRDVTALRYVTSISSQLWIERTPIEALPFAPLAGPTQAVILEDNSLLADVSSLRNLTAIDNFTLGRSALRSVPAFERLTQLGAFILDQNPLLEVGPAFPSVRSISLLDVSLNPRLETLLGFSALESAGYITISRNAELTEIDLGQLRESSTLMIFGNSRLDGAAAAQELAGVASEQIRIPVSQQTTLPLTPCPWTQDPICDRELCSPEQDPACGVDLY